MQGDSTLPAIVQEVMDDVADAVAKDMDRLLDAWMPDGVPFGGEKLSERQQLRQYLQMGLHESPDAAAYWIRTHVAKLQEMATAFGVTEDKMASIHPYNIAQVALATYSAKMESLLLEEQGKDNALRQLAAPSVPVLPVVGEMTDDLSE